VVAQNSYFVANDLGAVLFIRAAIIRTSSAFVNGCHPCGFIGRPYSNTASAFGLSADFKKSSR
jgi:hypothetical protein